nr:unnamed protein product [Digitaria exilis]
MRRRGVGPARLSAFPTTGLRRWGRESSIRRRGEREREQQQPQGPAAEKPRRRRCSLAFSPDLAAAGICNHLLCLHRGPRSAVGGSSRRERREGGGEPRGGGERRDHATGERAGDHAAGERAGTTLCRRQAVVDSREDGATTAADSR